MKSPASCEGASSTRPPSGRWTMTSDSGPSGEAGQWPTTTRVPDAVPAPRIQPSNRSRRAIRSEGGGAAAVDRDRSEEHTSELQSRQYLVCRLLLEKKNIPVLHHEDDEQASARERSEEHTSELQPRQYLVCRLLLAKKHNHTLILNLLMNATIATTD